MIQALICALIGVVAIGIAISKLPASKCSQDCSQGRRCGCKKD